MDCHDTVAVMMQFLDVVDLAVAGQVSVLWNKVFLTTEPALDTIAVVKNGKKIIVCHGKIYIHITFEHPDGFICDTFRLVRKMPEFQLAAGVTICGLWTTAAAFGDLVDFAANYGFTPRTVKALLMR